VLDIIRNFFFFGFSESFILFTKFVIFNCDLVFFRAFSCILVFRCTIWIFYFFFIFVIYFCEVNTI
jgi:hypothetical protein